MKKTAYSLLLLISYCFSLNAQPTHTFTGGIDTAWVRLYGARLHYGGKSLDRSMAFDIDASGNVYVTGSSVHSGTDDFATVKYDSSGELRWASRYTGQNTLEYIDDCPSSLVVDTEGNIYVAGFVDATRILGGYEGGQITVIKYNPFGGRVWVSRNDCSGQTSSLDVDSRGNVYVTGRLGLSTSDYCTIKYDASGDTLWVRTYDGPGGHLDRASAVAVDGEGNVYVTGTSIGLGGGSDYATIKYSSLGEQLWVRRYNGTAAGYSLNTPLAVDVVGNAYVTGSNWGSDSTFDYATIKYNPSGDTAWVRRYSGLTKGDDRAFALQIDDNGNAYVAGYSRGQNTGYDYVTIKYTPSGDTVWIRRYNGPDNGDDAATTLVVDAGGNVYVAGRSGMTGSSDGNFTTMKYDAAGNVQWVATYACEWGSTLTGILLDHHNNVYVVGTSCIGDQSFYIVIKYAQTTTEIKHQLVQVPAISALRQNYPNPMNPSTTISYALPQRSHVTLTVFNMLGQQVTTLVNGEIDAGYHEARFDARGLASGVYLYRLQAGDYSDTKKLILLR